MNIYKKISQLLPLATLLLIVGCGPSGNSFRLKGSIEGMQGGELLIYNTSENNSRLDTVYIDAGNFYYGGTAEEATPYIIVFPNALEQVVFIGPGEEIEYEAVASGLNNYIVSGSDENKLMNKFRTDIQNASYSDIQAKARKFISENATSVVALYIFDRYFLQNEQTTYKELTDVLEMLRKGNEEKSYFITLAAKVKAMKSIGIGDSFPDFKMKSSKKTSSMWVSKSQHTLFLCWATWIPDSYEFMNKVRNGAAIHSKDEFRFVTFSIDGEYDRWNNMTRYDSTTTIEHYIDTRAFDSPVLKQIGTYKIPTYFIMDSNHKVISKGDNPRDLEKDLDKYKKE